MRLGRDAKRDGFFSLVSHALRALCARRTLTPRFTDFFTDFEKKNRLFCSVSFEGVSHFRAPEENACTAGYDGLPFARHC